MATVFESVSLAGLRKAHLNQLVALLKDAQVTGYYWGNREQHEARLADLIRWAESARDYAYQHDVRMPKGDKAMAEEER